jgi:5'-nucleotidase/UDP-sugar diphosphatase
MQATEPKHLAPSRHRRLAALAGAALLLAACATPPVQPVAPVSKGLSLRILHINDHHSRVAPDSGQVLMLDGQPTQASFGGFPQLVTAFSELAQGADNLLKLHAGDAITGDLYFTLFAGEADADLMNQVCFDAFEVGNHEFDAGDIGLKRFLDFLGKRTWDCRTPALGANVNFTVGESPLAQFSQQDYLQPRIILERGGRRIGIVGIEVAGKTKGSSSPNAGTTFGSEARTAQEQIDALRASGVDIIILLTHIGYVADLELARSLSGVDVIVGGDSHSLLGEQFRQFGLSVEGPYPTRVQNRDGDAVCVAQAWQYTWVIGVLDLQFDSQGRVTDCGGRPVLLLGDDLRRDDKPLEGPARERAEAQIQASEVLAHFTPDPAAQHVLDFYRGQIKRFADEQVATVPQRLCLRRVPGMHDRSRDGAPGCAAATDSQGGHIQSLVAEYFLAQAKRFGGADIAIQNAGGARNGLAQGAFTVGDAYLALPFKNTLVRLVMRGSELRAVLEEAVDYFLSDQSANTGAYPYAAGLRWDMDLTSSRAQGRLQRIEFWNGSAWEPFDESRSYKVVANNYIAAGRDGYAGLTRVTGERREDTFLDYAQALVDQAREAGVVRSPPPERRSTQHFRDVDGRDYGPG